MQPTSPIHARVPSHTCDSMNKVAIMQHNQEAGNRRSPRAVTGITAAAVLARCALHTHGSTSHTMLGINTFRTMHLKLL
jgi:hypothetical protein